MSLLCFAQCVLLGSFAVILGAHRAEIIEKQGGVDMVGSADASEDYAAPYVQQ